MSTTEKRTALESVANGAAVSSAGNAKYRVRAKTIHVRFCSENDSAPTKYKFNINPNTLSADYELWICGSANLYYLVPISVIRDIYDNPNTYVDRHHPKIKVVSIDISAHSITYASGGQSQSLRPFLKATIADA